MRSAWSLVLLVWGPSLGVSPHAHAASVSPTLVLTTFTSPTEGHLDPTDPPRASDTGGLRCVSLPPPRRGSYYVERGTGVSVGSILVFWCRDGYQLVGSEKITCIRGADAPRWSSYLPDCESIPMPGDQGLHMALLVSVVSGMVIVVMTMFFIVCCIQEHQGKKKEKPRTNRSRKSDKWHSRSGGSSSWLVREELDWEAFPPLKIFSVSQSQEQEPSLGNSLGPGVNKSYENRGYQSFQDIDMGQTPKRPACSGEVSQESLMRSSRFESPNNNEVFNDLVIQKVQRATNSEPIPTSPAYLHIPTPSNAKAPCQHPST